MSDEDIIIKLGFEQVNQQRMQEKLNGEMSAQASRNAKKRLVSSQGYDLEKQAQEREYAKTEESSK